MKRTDLLERLSAANPVPGVEHVDPDELAIVFSVIEERRGIVRATKTPMPTPTIPRPPRRRSAAIALATSFGLAVAVILAAIVFMGGEESSEVGEQTPTTAGVTTTVGQAEEPTDTVPSEPPTTPGAVPLALELSDRPELGTRMALDQNGRPVIVSLTVEPGAETGMVRLFRFTDGFQPEVTDLYEAERLTQPVELAVGPNGDIYLLGIDSAGELDLLLFRQDELIDLPDVFTHATVGDYVTGWPVAFDGAGNPLFMSFEDGTGSAPQAELSLVACQDPLCTRHAITPIDTGSSVWPVDELLVDRDQVTVRYVIGTTWKEAIVDLGTGTVATSLLPDDYQPAPEQITAWPENVFDPNEYVAAGDVEGLRGANIQLGRCGDAGCTSREVTTVATTGGWMYLSTLSLEVADDATIYLAISVEDHGAELGFDDDIGLRLHVFPDGKLGNGVPAIDGFVPAPGWPAL